MDKEKQVITVRADCNGYVRAGDLKYQKPQEGSKQDNFTKKEINSKLKGYIQIKNRDIIHVKESTWIKYIDKKTGLFRVGGILSRVSYPDYIVLKNPYNKLSWSVQLKTNDIYVPDPRVKEKKIKEEDKKEQIYELYKRGLLKDTRKN